MKQLTIRGVDAALHAALSQEAQRAGTSVNRWVLQALRQAVGLQRQNGEAQRTFHDLDHLFGTWSDEQAAEFEAFLSEHRTIDPGLWS